MASNLLCWFFQTSVNLFVFIENSNLYQNLFQDCMIPVTIVTSKTFYMNVRPYQNYGYLLIDDPKENKFLASEILNQINIYSKFLVISEPNTNHTNIFATLEKLSFKNFLILEQNSNRVLGYDVFKKQEMEFDVKEYAAINKFLKMKNYFKKLIKSTLFDSIPNSMVSSKKEFYGMDPWVNYFQIFYTS